MGEKHKGLTTIHRSEHLAATIQSALYSRDEGKGRVGHMKRRCQSNIFHLEAPSTSSKAR